MRSFGEEKRLSPVFTKSDHELIIELPVSAAQTKFFHQEDNAWNSTAWAIA